MSAVLIYLIGFIAQLLFSARTFIQWAVSERSKKVITPTLFWTLSIIASFLMFLYGHFRHDFAIMIGQLLTYFIYIRNLHLQGKWKNMHKLLRFSIILISLLVFSYAFTEDGNFERLFKNENIPFWLLSLGIVAQLIFIFRFVYQWIYSEIKKYSSLPLGFWALSLVGSFFILIYGVFRLDPVLLIGHLFGLLVYSRNIYLLKNEHKQA